jgi:hypothetical protein
LRIGYKRLPMSAGLSSLQPKLAATKTGSEVATVIGLHDFSA